MKNGVTERPFYASIAFASLHSFVRCSIFEITHKTMRLMEYINPNAMDIRFYINAVPLFDINCWEQYFFIQTKNPSGLHIEIAEGLFALCAWELVMSVSVNWTAMSRLDDGEVFIGVGSPRNISTCTIVVLWCVSIRNRWKVGLRLQWATAEINFEANVVTLIGK